jgi:hypothetical protein
MTVGRHVICDAPDGLCPDLKTCLGDQSVHGGIKKGRFKPHGETMEKQIKALK